MSGNRNTLHIRGICMKYKEKTREIPNLKGKLMTEERAMKIIKANFLLLSIKRMK